MKRSGRELQVLLLSWAVLVIVAGSWYGATAATCYEDVVISNCAYEPANGTYRFVDFYQHRPVYRRIHDDGTFYPPYERIGWSGSQWVVMVGGTNRLVAQVDTPTPPNVQGCATCPNSWFRVNCGIPGPITVTVQGGGPITTLAGPTTSVLTTGEAYAYAPKIPEGCASVSSYTYSILNQPLWMSFDATTGALTGIPTTQDVGTYSGIQITATDSDGDTVATEVFAVTVVDVPMVGNRQVILYEDPWLQGASATITLEAEHAQWIEDTTSLGLPNGFQSALIGIELGLKPFSQPGFVTTDFIGAGLMNALGQASLSFPAMRSVVVSEYGSGNLAGMERLMLQGSTAEQWIRMQDACLDLSPLIDNQVTWLAFGGLAANTRSVTLYDEPGQQGASLEYAPSSTLAPDFASLSWGVSSVCIHPVPGAVVDCPPERLVVRGDSTAPTQDEMDWATEHGLTYTDTPQPDGATGDAVEWIERVWSNKTQFCIQTIAIMEPSPECPEGRAVLCGESADPTSEELQWATQNGLVYWDDGPEAVPGGPCNVKWIERFWGKYAGDENACSQGIDILYPTPTLVVPADATVTGCVTVASLSPSTTGTASVTDPCGNLVSLEYQDETDHSLNPEIGTFHRVWKATDQCGNTDRQIQTITISPPYPYLTGSWPGSFSEGDIVVDNIYINPQPPIFGNDQAHSLLIVAHAANIAQPPEGEDPALQTATLTASVNGSVAGSATISLLPGESGVEYEILAGIPQVAGCHEVSLSMGGTTIYGSVFIHPIGEDPDF